MAEASTRLQMQAQQLKAHLQTSASELVSDITARITGSAPTAAAVSKTLKTIG
jgi:hypothetical protein